LATVTAAPGIAPPEESTAVPYIVAVVTCALAVAASRKAPRKVRFIIRYPLANL
jgi:hypothetical protein